MNYVVRYEQNITHINTFLSPPLFFRLVEALNLSAKDHICVNSSKGQPDLKAKLKRACQGDKMVYIAKKYCNEEKHGTYFCLKEGKCLDDLCLGCVRHECEINGDR